ncbi:MAG: uncharacterized protein K0R38_2045 [Polyangiaceae bacterium]|jgi:hypothetical protein|nr:uncharacterized protein [Polyangiaceae bacterium]
MTWHYLALGALLALGTGCTVGDGSGSVTSERLYLSECWNGPFDLQPDFFAANPYREEALMIRVQRGDNNTEASDGVTVIVNDLSKVKLGEPIPVGVPNGVVPPGQPLTGRPNPLVTLSIYLHQTCHEQNSATYSVSGEITFSSIFSGNLNEENSDKRLTAAKFTARFADPRDLVDAADPDAVTSEDVKGEFSFYFQRGQPAQPFQ